MGDTKAPKALHQRTVDYRTWLHEDGALEIEARLLDTKAYDTRIGFKRELPAGEPVHEMTIRILLGPDRLIRDIRLGMPSTPFDICPEIIRQFEGLKGASMGKGWNALLSERFGGAGGCRHLVDLLRGMGTVVFQSLSRGGWSPEALAFLTDSCHAFRREGPVVERLAAEVGGEPPQANEKVK